MPNITSFFGHTITNLGPLTTTYTAPTSCATATDGIIFGHPLYPFMAGGFPSCDPGNFSDCIPSGDAFDKLSREQAYWAEQRFIHYYSPGLACPEGWTTAGTMNKADGTVGASGMLSMTPLETPTGSDEDEYLLGYLAVPQIWQEVLEEGEKLAYCCPIGFTGNDSAGTDQDEGYCYSLIGMMTDHGYSTGCAFHRTETTDWIGIGKATVGGVTTSYYSWFELTGSPETEHFRATEPTRDDDPIWAVATRVPVVALVYKDAAPGLSVRGMVPVVTVLTSMLAGAGLFSLW
ncbi:hypothetical protein ACJ41O_001182 [Fusarium nematophilum]